MCNALHSCNNRLPGNRLNDSSNVLDTNSQNPEEKKPQAFSGTLWLKEVGGAASLFLPNTTSITSDALVTGMPGRANNVKYKDSGHSALD